MDALMRIEGFRSLNQDIQTIIAKSEKVKSAKKSGKELTPKEKKELTDEEKEYKSLRKQIQEKLIKFATRIPIFMYLTDYREQTLVDVITQLEPGLFKKVTGLDVKDFELLCSLNVFNADLMNDAIYKFKRYEDSSLTYTGVNKHEGEKIGLFNTVINYDEMFVEQQASLEAPPVDETDIPETPVAIEPEEEEEPEIVEPPKAKPERKKKETVEWTKPKDNPIVAAVKKAVQPIIPFVKKTAKDSFDESKVVVGAKVSHKAFGAGTITGIRKDNVFTYVDVRFDDGVEKSFQSPNIFLQGFLKIEE